MADSGGTYEAGNSARFPAPRYRDTITSYRDGHSTNDSSVRQTKDRRTYSRRVNRLVSIARHHAEWLSSTEISGPFLSLPVPLRIFPDGLDAHDPEHLRLLRLAYEEPRDDQDGRRPSPTVNQAWIQFVLRKSLGFFEGTVLEGQAVPQVLAVTLAEHRETLPPDLVIANPAGFPNPGASRLLVQILPASQDLDGTLPDRR